MFKIIVEKSPKSQIIMPKFLANFIPSKFFNLFSGSSSDNDNVHENVDGISIENIVNGIKNRKYDHIIFMCGAGISTCMFKIVFYLIQLIISEFSLNSKNSCWYTGFSFTKNWIISSIGKI